MLGQHRTFREEKNYFYIMGLSIASVMDLDLQPFRNRKTTIFRKLLLGQLSSRTRCVDRMCNSNSRVTKKELASKLINGMVVTSKHEYTWRL